VVAMVSLTFSTTVKTPAELAAPENVPSSAKVTPGGIGQGVIISVAGVNMPIDALPLLILLITNRVKPRALIRLAAQARGATVYITGFYQKAVPVRMHMTLIFTTRYMMKTHSVPDDQVLIYQ
jgi:hypothetical protein